MTSLPRLSPTSYALLGLLARQPASAYELNNIMQTSMLRVFWPRAASHIYSEPKKLLAHNYVSERRETSKGRQRRVFTITASGRRALAAWLARVDDAEHRNQAEFMLKIILAEGGELADAAATAERALVTSKTEIEMAIAGIEAVLASPEAGALSGMPWNGIASGLMADILIARYRWGRYAMASIATVPEDCSTEQKAHLGRAAYRQSLEKLRTALAEDLGSEEDLEDLGSV
ncbi:PadR family transcriptional regulator [Seongchinamella unica]|uniref:PadR family transcriptional regulator n=1 Tax=Seongchinamella unica TaxID=2547392 RepID=A0A4R5LNF0_9GAMM|nr:PadR family transcriptional regulator [Seongchinamella unica]TDG11872.1 PadR family transcriptional regulator [Seongchinamella unica]